MLDVSKASKLRTLFLNLGKFFDFLAQVWVLFISLIQSLSEIRTEVICWCCWQRQQRQQRQQQRQVATRRRKSSVIVANCSNVENKIRSICWMWRIWQLSRGLECSFLGPSCHQLVLDVFDILSISSMLWLKKSPYKSKKSPICSPRANCKKV